MLHPPSEAAGLYIDHWQSGTGCLYILQYHQYGTRLPEFTDEGAEGVDDSGFFWSYPLT